MKRVLIVEDQLNDLQVASDILEQLGPMDVQARTNAAAARVYLEAALDGKRSMPDLMILDLNLGYESGFELLRFWHSQERLSGIEVVVWTIMAKEQQELCKLFGVKHVIPKWEGPDALRRAVEPLAAAAS
jgi:CheY-like chemotaxis protein